MAEAGLPDDFPIAWRTAPVRRRDPIVVHDAKTAFVQALFASLPRVQSENTNTTRLVSERTKRGPHRLFTNRYVDDRVLNHMCIPVLEFSMKLQRCSATEIDALAANLSKLARLYECGDHERLVELYEQLASLPGFVDVLRIGAGNELSRVLGGLVLLCDPQRVASATRCIRIAGRILKGQPKTPNRLLDKQFDWLNRSGKHETFDTDAQVHVSAMVVLQDRVSFVRANSARSTQDVFYTSLVALLDFNPQWSLIDALLPCQNIPIRTQPYVEFIKMVALVALRAIRDLEGASLPLEDAVAWGLATLATRWSEGGEAGGVGGLGEGAALKTWASARAHEPPAARTADWILARALLAHPRLDADALAARLEARLAAPAAWSRVATLVVATRTLCACRLVGCCARLAQALPLAIADGFAPLDCLSASPSGTLEFGAYESGWCEWACSKAPHCHTADSERCMSAIGRAIEAALESDQGLHAALRFSLISEQNSTPQSRSVLEGLQPALEACVQRQWGRLGWAAPAEPTAPTAPTARQAAALGARFRQQLHRTLCVVANADVVAAWLVDVDGRVAVFARRLHDGRSDLDVVLEFEQRVRGLDGAVAGVAAWAGEPLAAKGLRLSTALHRAHRWDDATALALEHCTLSAGIDAVLHPGAVLGLGLRRRPIG